MPAVTNPNAYLSDIGGATSKVLLGVWESNLYSVDGLTPMSRPGHLGGYQESWVDSQSSQLLHRSNYARLFPAEHWVQQWDAVSGNWEPIDVGGLSGLKLVYNRQPDAPMQTIVYGRLQDGVGMNDIPDLLVPAGGCPMIGQYVTTDPNVGPSLPGGGGGAVVIGQPQAFYDPGIDGSMGTPAQPELRSQALLSDAPFKPSSVDFIADSGGQSEGYKKDIRNRGIKIWNIWEMINPSPGLDGRRYLANHGPIWGSTTYGGPVAEQVGGVGSLRVRVTSNRGMATMKRRYPMHKCIGRDKSYPWIFPFVGPLRGTSDTSPTTATGGSFPSGAINHEIQSSGVPSERLMTTDGEEADGDKDPINIGFVLDIDITSESQRGFFGGSGGGSSSISVSWGSDTLVGGVPAVNSTWATGFTAYIAPNKVPYLLYHDGAKVSRIYLSESPIPSTMGTIKLRVEYHGLSMYVWLGETGSPVCVRGYNNWSGGERWGVYVAENQIQFTVSNCTAVYSFMPVYYNPWCPTQNVDFHAGDITNDTTPSDTFEFYKTTTFMNGMATLLNIGQFHLPTACDAGQVAMLIDSLNASMVSQSPTARQMAGQSPGWRTPGGNVTFPYFHQDEGWPVMLRDSRHIDCGVSLDPAILPLRVYSSQYLTARAVRWSDGQPTIMNTDTTTVNVMFKVHVTHTTPLVLGFKVDDYENPPPACTGMSPSNSGGSGGGSGTTGGGSGRTGGEPPSICEMLSPHSWEINWRSEGGDIGCIMRADAKITIVNPDPAIILAVANNQMRVQITETGYPVWAYALRHSPSKKLSQAVFADKPIFDGVTVGLSVNRTSSGKIIMTIEATDPIIMLERAMLETNLRFDGCNYVTTFCTLFRQSDYAGSMVVRLPRADGGAFPGVPSSQIGGNWMGASRAAELFPELATTHYFGYSPTTGRSYEVAAGTLLMAAITDLMSKMNMPSFVPLFYYDPTSSKFVFTRRGLNDTKGLWPGVSSTAGGMHTHPWIFDSPAMMPGTGLGVGSLAAGLMMQAEKGGSLYTLESSTKSLASHYLAFGNNRATGTPVKATAVNPRWNWLKGKTKQDWANTYGHMGYRGKVRDDYATFISDQVAARKYCRSRMWWLMRPILKLSNITVDGSIFPGGATGGLADGTVGIVTGDELFQNAFLDTATIRFNADEQRVQSTISCWIFPRV